MPSEEDDIWPELQREFLARTAARVETLGKCADALEKGEGGPKIIADMTREAHTMAGSGATFGHPLVTEIGRELERAAAEGPALPRIRHCLVCLDRFLDLGPDFDEAALAALRRDFLAGTDSP